MKLYNHYSNTTLKEFIAQEKESRIVLSFYRYVHLGTTQQIQQLRDSMYYDCSVMNILGRIYLASEGINAQISVPQSQMTALREYIDTHEYFHNIPFKIALEHNSYSFLKLKIKIRSKILADGLNDDTFNPQDVGMHLSAAEFNELADDENSIIIDMRNDYECTVGHFKNAYLPKNHTFRDVLTEVLNKFDEHKNDKIFMLYCTGGIRCEKTSAYLRHQGFKQVTQLSGGIINYAQEIKKLNLENKYIGKNFVFDNRLGERISNDIIAQCQQCGVPCDTHINCQNSMCHKLFIQCDACAQLYDNCCGITCKRYISLDPHTQKEIRLNHTIIFSSKYAPLDKADLYPEHQ